MNRIHSVLCCLLWISLTAQAAQTNYVNQAGTNTIQNGQSWATAYRDLQTAIANANPSPSNIVEIWVAAGTYKPGTSRTASFNMKSNLRILGGFRGNETNDTRFYFGYPTVLSGDIGTPMTNRLDHSNIEFRNPDMDVTDTGLHDNCFNVVTVLGVTNVVLDKVYITGGWASETNIPEVLIDAMSVVKSGDGTNAPVGQAITQLDRRVAGGGIFVTNRVARGSNEISLIMNQVTLKNNGTRAYGGAIASKEARVMFGYSQVFNNYAGEQGAGFWAMNNINTDIHSCEFRDNRTDGSGGAVMYVTMPSSRTISPSVTIEEMRQAVMNSVAAVITVVKVGPKLYAATKVAGFANKIKTVLPNSPFEALAGTTKLQKATQLPSRFVRLYGAVALAVAAIDVGVWISTEIAGLFGEDIANTTFVKDWTWFSDKFNRYATPQGWITMLFEVTGLIREASVEQKAIEIKKQQRNFYNAAPYSVITSCKFISNTALLTGGAIAGTYDNLHIEGCVFEYNTAGVDGAAIINACWNKPEIVSCAFYKNVCLEGHSAIINTFHARAQILNCTFIENGSELGGSAIGNEMGSEVTVCNSVLWGNTNVFPENANGGADIFTMVRTNLVDAESLTAYNDAQGARGDFVAICDVSFSCVQSLNRMPLGSDHFEIVFPAGFSNPTRSQINNYIAEYNILLFEADLAGLLDHPSRGVVNIGEGNRPNILDKRKGNFDSNPLLINKYIPSTISPLVDAGATNRFNNGLIGSYTGVDILDKSRFFNGRIDMGAVEYQGGKDPLPLPGLPPPHPDVLNQFILRVDPGATGNNTGSSWENAKTNLQEALSTSNVEVWVKRTTYYPTSGTDRNASFTLGHNVRVYGGFNGHETTRTERSLNASLTVLSGDIGVPNVDTDNSFHVIKNTNRLTDSRTILDGFTITKGRGDVGGGVCNTNADPTFQNCRFIDNRATQNGGAAFSTGIEGSTFINCVFADNSATNHGGAIFFTSRLVSEGCHFLRNTASSGGALCVTNNGHAYIYNAVFNSNSITGGNNSFGGAVFGRQTSMTLNNCTFVRNMAFLNTTEKRGGGAVDFAGTGEFIFCAIENSIFWRNGATNSGGPAATLERQQIELAENPVMLIFNNIIEGLEEYAGPTSYANLDVDPQFTFPDFGVFELRHYSPAIDAGQNNTGGNYPTVDFLKNPRLSGPTMDIGAYEFQGTPLKLAFQVGSTRICDANGAINVFPLIGTNSALMSYRWEVNKNDGLGFLELDPVAPYGASVLSSSLTITYPSLSMNGYRYRVRGNDGTVAFTSTSAKLQVSRTRFYVKADATGANDGSSWANAYTNLLSAFQEAGPCSQIWVAAGTYYPSLTGNVNDVLRMKSDIAIYGGFNGTEATVNQRNWRTNVTIISGNMGNAASTNDNSYTLIYNYGNQVGLACDSSAILDGFTLMDAQDTAMINLYAHPTIRNCTFTNNHGLVVAGMRNDNGSSPLIANCQFLNNTGADAGAVECSGESTAKIINSTFKQNRGGHRGGAISTFRSRVQVVNCTIVDNFAMTRSGGIYQQGGTNAIVNCIIWGNSDNNNVPTPTGAQILPDTSSLSATVLNMTNTCVQGWTNLADGNFGFDPLFANPATNDYRLSFYSPAVNAGVSAAVTGFTTDVAGALRIVHSAVDLGAYEFQGAVSATPARLVRLPQSVTACNAVGKAQFSVVGTNNSAASFTWEINKGNGFVPLATSGVTNTLVLSNDTSTVTFTNLSLSMNGYQLRVRIPSVGFVSAPVTLSVVLPTVIYVDDSATGAGSGYSWTDAYTNLQQALSYADECSEIWVAAGSYPPTPDAQGYRSFRLKSQVALYGGFAGTETSITQRNWTTNISLIANSNSAVALIDNHPYLVPIEPSAVLDGFTLTASRSGAIYNQNANPTIRNCTFTGNYRDCIFNRDCAPAILNCVFTNNSCAGVYNQLNAFPLVSNCVFVANRTLYSGGAIFNNVSSPQILDCVFRENSAGWGGAICNDADCSPIITRCAFFNNTANSGGGALHNSIRCAPIVKNCLFVGNTSRFRGGAIADYGNGMKLINSTLAQNSSYYSGAGLYYQGTTATVQNSIIWGNTSANNLEQNSLEKNQVDVSGDGLNVSHTIVEGYASLGGVSNFGYDPLFIGASTGDFRLGNHSPAIDSGDNTPILSETLDLDRTNRVFVTTVDRGAFEYQDIPTGTLYINGFPASQNRCVASTVQFTVVKNPLDIYPFFWQRFNGSVFEDVNTGGAYTVTTSGTTNLLEIANVTLAMNGDLFRFTVPDIGYTSPSFSLAVRSPSIIHVNVTNVLNGTGATWSEALTNLQDAITLADDCSEIWVAAGTYIPNVTASGGTSYRLRKGLRIYGGFAGFETSLSQRDWTTNVSVLLGRTNSAVFENNGFSSPIDATALLDGFTISGANSGQASMYNVVASPTIRNCTFVEGKPGVWNTVNAGAAFIDCVFSNNTLHAVVNVSGSPSFTGCRFVNNTNSSGVVGGAISLRDSSSVFTDCEFLDNFGAAGGAMAIDGNSTPVVTRGVFMGNSSGFGGAVYCFGTSPSFDNCLFVRNTSTFNSGALVFGNCQATLNNCTITENSSANNGGGVYVEGGTVNLTNCIVWNNRDDQQFGGTVETAQIYNISGSGTITVAHSTVQGLSLYTGNDNNAFDPLFADVASNDFTPGAFSPAIDSGHNSVVIAGAADVNGGLRIVRSTVDRGAVEAQNPVGTEVAQIVSSPSDQSTCPGGAVHFAVIGAANSGNAFSWEVDRGSGFESIPNDGKHFISVGSDTSTLSVSNVVTTMDNYLYRFNIASNGFVSRSFRLDVFSPRVIYVKHDAIGSQTGADWANAFTNLHPAVALADTCSEIWVAAGDYYPAPTGGLDRSIRMKPGLKIYGGFDGSEGSLAQRDWTNYIARLISTTNAAFIDNRSDITPTDRSSVLDGFVITSIGRAIGIANSSASPTIRNCRFEENGFFAIANIGTSSPWIENCLFTNNFDISIDSRGGGRPVITNCTFINNRSLASGGTVFNAGPHTTILDSRFMGNRANGSGGSINNYDGICAVVGCVFSDNEASSVGGALMSLSTEGMFVTNSVFYGNRAFHGGAAYNQGKLILANCTITGNEAGSSGGAVVSGNGEVQLLNTIVWQNTAQSSFSGSAERRQLYTFDGSIVASNSCVQNLEALAGNGNISEDPLFFNPDAGDYSLSPYSAAIDAGEDEFVTAPLDAGGLVRIQLGGVDMGAHESATELAPLGLVTSPSSQMRCVDDTAVLTVQALSPTTFGWEYFNGSGWTAFVDGGNGILSGPAEGLYSVVTTATSSSLTVAGITATMDGYKYRFIIPGVFNGAAVVLHIAPTAVIYVNGEAPSGGDGLSWATAFNDLQTALASVNGCRRALWLAAGTYYPTPTEDQTDNFSVPAGAAIYGGFIGTETHVNQRDWTANPTILSGDIGVRGNSVGNSTFIVTMNGRDKSVGTNTVLDGLIMERGGQGINLDTASPTIRNCTIQLNVAGGISTRDSSPVVDRCVIQDNSTPSSGGGVDMQKISGTSSPIIRNTVFKRNTAGSGGAINCRLATPLIANCLIYSNSATGGGGAISGQQGTFTVVNSTIYGNTTPFSGGGAIATGPSTAIIKNSILWNNTSTATNIEVSQIDIRFGGGAFVSNSCIEGVSVFTNSNNNGFDPMFVNPALANFHLRDCSPLINIGVNAALSGVTTDLDGLPRFVGLVDLGAFEFQDTPADALAITTQPASFPYCPLTTNAFDVVATGTGLVYQWEINRLNSFGFVDLANDAVFSGATDAHLGVFNPGLALNLNQFRCRITSPAGCVLYSRVAIMRVPPSQVYVNASAAAGGDGLSWDTAFQTLQAAMNSPLLSGCKAEIWVAAGTYTSTAALKMKSGVEIYGGFDGTETIRSERDWTNNLTVLQSGASHSVFDNNGQQTPCDQTAVLDGCTITGPHFGVQNQYASPTIRNCRFEGNQQVALYVELSSSPLVENCEFVNNASRCVDTRSGSTATFLNCSFVNNSGLTAGSVASSDGTLIVSNCTFKANSASQGAIFNDTASHAIVINSTFEKNQNSGIVNAAGALNLTVTNCVFIHNRGQFGAGIASHGTATMVNCTFFDNAANIDGSGLYVAGGLVTVRNSIFWQNQPTTSSGSDVERAQVYRTGGTLLISDSCVQGLSLYAGNNNSLHDPLFAGSGQGNFRLNEYSPLIDQGNNSYISGMTIDRTGSNRVVNAVVDVGALESASVASPAVLLSSTPQSLSVCDGGTAVFTVVAPGATTFAWEYFNGTSWAPFNCDINGVCTGPALGTHVVSSTANSSTLTVSSASTGMNGYLYRFSVSGSSFRSGPIVLTVTASGVVFVNAAAAAGGDGTTWGTAYNNLQTALSALNSASCGNVIWLAAGTYRPTTGSDTSARFEIPAGAGIYGGFNGTEANLVDRDWTANPTILSGDIGTIGNASDDSQNIVYFNGSASTIDNNTILDGVIVEKARLEGVRMIFASPIVRNCTLRQNNIAAFLHDSDPLLQGCLFVSNNVAGNGAGVTMFFGTPRLQDCAFRNNSASGVGGGVYVQGASPQIYNCVFAGNFAAFGGGLGFGVADVPVIVNSTFSDNTAINFGGGIYGSITNLTVKNSILWNNSADGLVNEDAQLHLSFGTHTVSNSCVQGLSTLSGNGNVDNNPVFVNPDAGDYHLQACSPLIDLGNSAALGTVTTDIDGNPRVANASVDPGAYEYQTAPSTALSITTQPSSLDYCTSGGNTFTVTASGAGLSYGWEVDQNDGNGFTSLSDDTNYTGSATAILSVSNVTPAFSGYRYRAVVSTSAGCALRSEAASLTFPVSRWYVKANAPAGGNGLSWATAFQKLSDALTVPTFAPCDNQIWVAAGTYYPPASGGMRMVDKVAIYGGFLGTETNLSQRNWKTNLTILSGDIGVPDEPGDNAANIFFNEREFVAGQYKVISPLARLDGFILEKAFTAMVNPNSPAPGPSPTVANCTFRFNSRGMENFYCSPVVLNCVFEQNGNSSIDGPAIYNFATGDPILIQGCIFRGNTADFAGAVWNEGGAMTLDNCLFSGNTANSAGAFGASASGASVVVRNCTFTGNKGNIFAAFQSGVPTTVYNSIFWNNYWDGYPERAQIGLRLDMYVNVHNCVIQSMSNSDLNGRGNTSADPRFVQNINAEASPQVGGDFRLNSCTTIVNAGNNTYVTSATDLEGNPRIQGGVVDIGAYEGVTALSSVVITSQPTNQAGVLGSAVQFTVGVTANNPSYRWQISEDGNLFFDIFDGGKYSGGNTPTLTVTNLSTELIYNFYRCKITENCIQTISETASLSINNLAPMAASQVVTNDEDQSISITLTGSDSDLNALTFTIVDQPSFGQLTGTPPNVDYLPNPEYNGPDYFTFTVNDGLVDSAPAAVSITVQAVNDQPVINSQSFTINEDEPFTFALDAFDIEGDPLTMIVQTPLEHGTLTGPVTNLTFKPETNFNGSDLIQYIVNDGGTNSLSNALIIFTINPVNDAPVALADSTNLFNGGTIAINVLPNDTDVENDALTITGVTQGTNGSVAFTGSSVTYTHNGSFSTNDVFTYFISDVHGASATGVVQVVIAPPPSLVVTNTANNGPGTLREAIKLMNEFQLPYTWNVSFSPALAGQTINLTTVGETNFGASALGLLTSNHVVIDAAAAPGVTIQRDSGAPLMRLLRIGSQVTLTLKNINLSGGIARGGDGKDTSGGGGGGGGAGMGGAICNEGTLVLENIQFTGNQAAGGKGGAWGGTGNGAGGGPNGGTGQISGAGGFGGGGGGASSAGSGGSSGPAGFGGGAGGGLGSAAAGGAGGIGGGGGGGNACGGGGGMGAGGALFNRSGQITLENCLFSGNSVAGGAAGAGSSPNADGQPGRGYGAGIFNYNGTISLLNGTITNNTGEVGGIYNIGNAATATFDLTNVEINNPAGGTNLVQSILNGGSVQTISAGTTILSQSAPFVRNLPNTTIAGAAALNFRVSAPLSGPYSIAAISENQAVIPDANLNISGTGTNRTLSVVPTFGLLDTARLAVTIIDGNLSFIHKFNVTTDRNLSASLRGNESVVIPVLDTNSSWFISAVTQGTNGSVTFTPGSLTYSAASAGPDTDFFTYQISDGTGTASGNVSITITPANVVPIASNQVVTLNEDTLANITLTGSDAESAPLTFTVLTTPTNGTFIGSGTSYQYRPATNSHGADSFTFSVSDGLTSSLPATVSINIAPVNDSPTVVDQTVRMRMNTSLNITLTGADIEGDNLTFVTGSPANGVLNGTGSNRVYTPTTGFTGADSFTFHANDGSSNSLSATVYITVGGILSNVVTTAADSGAGSLRAALDAANADDINTLSITFDGALANQTINLTTIGDYGLNASAFIVSNSVIIDGGVLNLSIARQDPGAPSMRLFRVATNAELTLKNVKLQNGVSFGGNGLDGAGGGGGGAGMGGAIFSEGSVTIVNATLTNNQALGGYGGRYDTGGLPDYQAAGGTGGGFPKGGIGGVQVDGGHGGFGGGGAGSGTPNSGWAQGGSGGFGGRNGGSFPNGPYTIFGGNGGFGAGGGGGWLAGGGGGMGAGGAIFNSGGTLTILNSVISSNVVMGGGSYAYNNAPATAGQGLGGGIFNRNGTIVLSNVVFDLNSASNAGGIYNLGDSGTVLLSMENVTLNNPSGGCDFVQNTINNGFSHTAAQNVPRLCQAAPSISYISNQTATAVDFVASAPTGSPTNYTLVATSGNTAFVPNSGLSISSLGGTSNRLTIVPATLSSNQAVITVKVTDGPISFAEKFTFTLNYDDIHASVFPSDAVTINVPVDGVNTYLTGVSQGTRGSVTFTPTTITYTHAGGAGTSDTFNFTLSNGSGTGQGAVFITIRSLRLLVTTAADSGAGSLREIVALANAVTNKTWIIGFDPSLAGQTISLSTIGNTNAGSSALSILGGAVIDGAGAPGLSIERNAAALLRHFHVDTSAKLVLRNLALNGGFAYGGNGDNTDSGGGGGGGAGMGGAIYNRGLLTIENVTFANNQARGGNGGSWGFTGTARGGGVNGGTGQNSGAGGFGGGGGGSGGAPGVGAGGAAGFGAGLGGGDGTAGMGGPGGFGGGGGGGNACGGGGGLGAGGAIFNHSGTVMVKNSAFGENIVSGGSPGFGYLGGLTEDDGTNGAGYGGAIFNYNGQLTVLSSILTNNFAEDGGGIYNYSASAASIVLNNVDMTNMFGSDFESHSAHGGTVSITGNNNRIGSQDDVWIGSMPDIAILSPALFTTVNFSVGVPAGGGSYPIFATSADQSLIPDGNLEIQGVGNNRTLKVTPAFGMKGRTEVTVSVSDGAVTVTEVIQVNVGLFVAIDQQNGARVFRFTALPGATYQIEYTTSLNNPVWNNIGAATEQSPGSYSFVDPNPTGPVRYYRIRVQ